MARGSMTAEAILYGDTPKREAAPLYHVNPWLEKTQAAMFDHPDNFFSTGDVVCKLGVEGSYGVVSASPGARTCAVDWEDDSFSHDIIDNLKYANPALHSDKITRLRKQILDRLSHQHSEFQCGDIIEYGQDRIQGVIRTLDQQEAACEIIWENGCNETVATGCLTLIAKARD